MPPIATRAIATPALLVALLVAGLAVPAAARAQDDSGGWTFDPSVLATSGGDLLRRAPDPQIDGLFQAVHAATRDDHDAQALCRLFEPDADRSLAGLNAVAAQLGNATRQQFAGAVADILVAAVQSPVQAYDAAGAWQLLKSAGATAAILHDGFLRGLQADGSGVEPRHARCQSLRWLLDAVQARPAHERAAITRLLLDQGLARLAPTPGVAPAGSGR